MDQAYISTISALAGTVIGGFTLFLTSWVTQTAQVRAARLAAERTKREDMYGRYIDEIAVLYSHALSSDQVDYTKLVNAFALKGRIVLLATPPVVDSANRAATFLVDLYMGPPRGPAEVRQMMEDHGADAISAFAKVCRIELENLRV
jgi:hypothetical protein